MLKAAQIFVSNATRRPRNNTGQKSIYEAFLGSPMFKELPLHYGIFYVQVDIYGVSFSSVDLLLCLWV